MDFILTIMDLANSGKSAPDQNAFDWLSFIVGLMFVFATPVSKFDRI
jgi:hypothetical protein